MSRHPASTTLESFLLSGLSWKQTKKVVLHLLHGCDRCKEAMEPVAMSLLSARWPEREPTSEEDAAYDAAISAACRRVLETLRKDKKDTARQTFESLARRGREAGLAMGRP